MLLCRTFTKRTLKQTQQYSSESEEENQSIHEFSEEEEEKPKAPFVDIEEGDDVEGDKEEPTPDENGQMHLF